MPDPFCHTLPCTELKERRHLYLMKSELLQHLRDEHARLWRLYEQVYDAEEGPKKGEYGDRAVELLTRCRLFDNLYNNLQQVDLHKMDGFGDYCKRVFQELQRQQPAFPDSAVSLSVFDEAARELRRLVMKQNERWG